LFGNTAKSRNQEYLQNAQREFPESTHYTEFGSSQDPGKSLDIPIHIYITLWIQSIPNGGESHVEPRVRRETNNNGNTLENPEKIKGRKP
jgi:hypothetical protein